MHIRVLRELADVVDKPISLTSGVMEVKGSASGECKNGSTAPIFKKVRMKDLGHYQTVSLTSVPGKVLEQIFLQDMLRHKENRKMIWDSQLDFTKGKSYLTNPVAFSDGVTTLLDKKRATDVIYLDLCKAFDTILHNV
ncbi:hypothetical protein HGM15179_013902 [Zosterops borbonicus]|uniref:Rna-directed dna polymerase from mobile element jockey-like n=1 Tax=Zosterops borbonicus TaxID=364589 RepID=A0A8K1G874_9PASS|nr:hypothetical protein HGM15179_013902 [Zosterops borbonicus]